MVHLACGDELDFAGVAAVGHGADGLSLVGSGGHAVRDLDPDRDALRFPRGQHEVVGLNDGVRRCVPTRDARGQVDRLGHLGAVGQFQVVPCVLARAGRTRADVAVQGDALGPQQLQVAQGQFGGAAVVVSGLERQALGGEEEAGTVLLVVEVPQGNTDRVPARAHEAEVGGEDAGHFLTALGGGRGAKGELAPQQIVVRQVQLETDRFVRSPVGGAVVGGRQPHAVPAQFAVGVGEADRVGRGPHGHGMRVVVAGGLDRNAFPALQVRDVFGREGVGGHGAERRAQRKGVAKFADQGIRFHGARSRRGRR